MTVMAVRPWMVDRDGHASDCKVAAERSADIGAQLSALEAEESELIRRMNSPGFREERHRSAGEALANGLKPNDVVPDVRGRLKEIAEEKPPLNAAMVVLAERYEKALQEAKAELSRELRPEYIERLRPMVKAAVDLLAAAKAELEWRVPLVQQDISFAGGHLQGLPLGAAGPDAQILIWLRRVDRHYGELGVRKLAAKRGVEL